MRLSLNLRECSRRFRAARKTLYGLSRQNRLGNARLRARILNRAMSRYLFPVSLKRAIMKSTTVEIAILSWPPEDALNRDGKNFLARTDPASRTHT